jgi:hypothetical protein
MSIRSCGDTDSQGEGHVTKEAETGVMQLQKIASNQLEAERGEQERLPYRAPPTPWFQMLSPQDMRQCISVVLKTPVCDILS